MITREWNQPCHSEGKRCPSGFLIRAKETGTPSPPRVEDLEGSLPSLHYSYLPLPARTDKSVPAGQLPSQCLLCMPPSNNHVTTFPGTCKAQGSFPGVLDFSPSAKHAGQWSKDEKVCAMIATVSLWGVLLAAGTP